MNAKLFINYRREDTAPYAGRLYDRLTERFGEDKVFIDIDQIGPGEDFVEVINRKVGTCDIAIVMIGPHWLSARDASGKRRLDDEEDFVRMEIVAALQRNISVIPVLVGGAQMPRKEDLPEALRPLSRRNAIELSEIRFRSDVNRLIEAIQRPKQSKKRKLWTTERVIILSALVLLLLGLAWFLMKPDHQNAPRNSPNALRISPNPLRISPNPLRISPNPARISPNAPTFTPNPASILADHTWVARSAGLACQALIADFQVGGTFEGTLENPPNDFIIKPQRVEGKWHVASQLLILTYNYTDNLSGSARAEFSIQITKVSERSLTGMDNRKRLWEFERRD